MQQGNPIILWGIEKIATCTLQGSKRDLENPCNYRTNIFCSVVRYLFSHTRFHTLFRTTHFAAVHKKKKALRASK